MVPRVGLLDPLIRNTRIENRLHAVGDQPCHMAVGDLCRIAFRLAGDRFDTQLVDGARGLRREYHAESQFLKECRPERIIFIEIQHPRNADGSARRLIFRERLIVEDAVVFVIKQIRDLPARLLPAKSALTAVAADKLPAAFEAVDRQDAVVGAALAAGHGGLVLQADDVVERHHRGCAPLVPLPGDQCRAERAHDPRDVRADRLAAGDLLEAAKHRVIVESAALNDYIFTQIRRAGDLDDLI